MFKLIMMGRCTSIYAKKHNIKQKKTREIDMGEDRISQLPDEVLVSILSFLTMKEAARTSVIACRWREVWTSIPSLDFDASETLNSLWEQEEGLNPYEEKRKYVKWVNNVLDAYQGNFIDEFRVRFDLDAKYTSHIDRWFNFALEKKVKRLVMDFRGLFGFHQPENNVCAIPLLSSPVLHTAGFPDCRFLRILKLKYLDSTCLYLERLVIEGSNSLTDLNVVGQSLCLKHLKIKFCKRLKSVYLSASSLLSFKYHDTRMIGIAFANVPNLVEVFFGGLYSLRKLHPLLNYLSQLETLVLSIRLPKETIGLIEFPVLPHLKNLRLNKVFAADDNSLLGFTPLIKAAPSLCRLLLELFWFEPEGYLLSRPKGLPECHQCLKVVEIVGFVGKTNDMEFVMYFIEHAPMLEKIILHPEKTKIIKMLL
ncbi:F-box/LRR-repeat protein At3g58900-like [Tripterygium wilfordii]|uniref:F-box/LRR-repeat protein At3g58900-like n=1 Tax=Tripterygium wilfordii TaxID=458696 RepID=UPI0018F83DD3|nr:F-box/LRR-repeat protein At3g58900-like [Tripterygium wilfordii]